MQIWSAEIKELETLYTSLKGRFPQLEKELDKLVKAHDENMVLLYSRRCLEVIISDLCECELQRPRGTEPLKGVIDKLSHEKKVPSHIIASMEGLNTLSTFGTHPKEFDPEQVKPVLNNLTTIIKWHLKYKGAQAISKPKPEEVKDETKGPGDFAEHIQKPKKRLILWLSGIALIFVIAIVALFVFDIIGGEKRTREIEKSIAVLPFKSLSTDPEKQYLADGMMDAVLLHLSKIADLRVLSRTSTEQYKEPGKTMTEIGKELGVSYLLEGSFQKFGDDARLIVQLIQTGKEGHVWANEYDRKWNDIFSVQSEVAQAIADELKAIVTPEEKQLIEKIPTTNLTAYDFYQRGNDELRKGDIKKADNLYHKALEYDSTFAQAYLGLARVYWNKHYWSEYFSENFMDSVLRLADIALSFDDQLADAYYIRGECYRQIGDREKAIKEYDKAIKLNPNDSWSYNGKAHLYLNDEFVEWIENLEKAVSLNHDNGLPDLLRNLSWAYICIGFPDRSLYYAQEALKLDDDSLQYYMDLSYPEAQMRDNYEKAIEYLKKGYKIDSNNIGILNFLGLMYTYSGQDEESLKYYKKWYERLKASGELDLDDMHRIGYAYWKNGYKEEAEYYFNKQIVYCNKEIELQRFSGHFKMYFVLAGVYAFRGETDKAFENLRIFNQQPRMPVWRVAMIKHDPLFDSIRDEPEFQQIVRDVEAKYRAEHERVRRWLEEQGIL
jgi:TolB-like protein/Tfp pilus assembly protein PilF